jgi:hypothetical protein
MQNTAVPAAAAAVSNNTTPALVAAANDNMNSATVQAAATAVNNNATPAAGNFIPANNFLLTNTTPNQPTLETPPEQNYQQVDDSCWFLYYFHTFLPWLAFNDWKN